MKIKTTTKKTTGTPALQRRTFLRGMLGGAAVALALPTLEAMLDGNGTAYAASGSAIPRRFGVFYWGCGIVHSTWVPSAQGSGFALPDALSPFSGALAGYVSMATGTNHRNSSPGHIPARGLALSSSHDMTVCQGSCVGTYRGQSHPEPSVDAIVAEAWKGQAQFDHVGVGICRKGPYKSNSSWNRGGSGYNRHEPSPQALFDRLFSNQQGSSTPTPDPLLATSTAFEKSMLDAVLVDANRLRSRLGNADKQRIDQHLEGLRAIERQLQARGVPTPAGPTCPTATRPSKTNFGDGGSKEEKEAKSKLFSELLAIAMACDLTRVFSYEWSATQSEAVYWEVSSSTEHHELSHNASTGTEMKNVVKFIMKNFAYLAQKLYEQPVAGGNLLDHTLILGTSAHANAGSHNYTDHPYVYVGGAGGGIKKGVHWRHASPSGNQDAPKCLLTAVRAVGIPLAKIGQQNSDGGPRVASDPISALIV
ncbi:MAG: DUF1552 domain-containing protein [Myxococcales bacterium]|nr:DUF1552 domain-containing protein [Myxococcales bacterium]